MKNCFNFLVIKKMQIKTTLQHKHRLKIMTKFKEPNNIKCSQGHYIFIHYTLYLLDSSWSVNWKNHFQFSSVQLLSCVQIFVTPWSSACQASMFITNKIMLETSLAVSTKYKYFYSMIKQIYFYISAFFKSFLDY